MNMTFDELMDCFVLDEASESNRTTYDELLNYARNNTIVPFIGAGVSVWAYPGWSALLKDLSRNVGLNDEVNKMLANNNYEEAASIIEAEYGQVSFLRAIEERFSDSLSEKKDSDRPVYTNLIPFIFQGPIITTNFDHCIEHYFFKNRIKEPEKVMPLDNHLKNQLEKSLFESKRILIKMHGDISDSKNLILTKEAYEKVYGTEGSVDLSKPMSKFLQALLCRDTLLFIGCSLEADRTCEIIQACSPNHRHFAILPMPEDTYSASDPIHPRWRGDDNKIIPSFNKRRLELVNERNLHVIWYPPKLHNEAIGVLLTQLGKDLYINCTNEENTQYEPLRELVGRESLIKTVEDTILHSKTCCTWVQGPMGIGKTELCKATVKELKNTGLANEMLFINLCHVNNIYGFFDVIANTIEAPKTSTNDITELSKQLLSLVVSRKISLYLDNWEDVWYGIEKDEQQKRLIVGWLNALVSKGVMLLVSSRVSPPSAIDCSIINVPPLDNAKDYSQLSFSDILVTDASKMFISILQRPITDIEKENYRKIINELEGHPLSIVLVATQARKEINLNWLAQSWEIAEQESAGNKYDHKSLNTAIRMSWNAIKDYKEAVIQWGLLSTSVLPIPVEAMELLREKNDEIRWHKGLERLIESNLCSPTGDHKAIDMLTPIKKTYQGLLGNEDLYKAVIDKWAAALLNILESAGNLLGKDRLEKHTLLVRLIPQVNHIIVLLLNRGDREASNTVIRMAYAMGNYFPYSLQSIEILKELVEYYSTDKNNFYAYLKVCLGKEYRRFGQLETAINCYSEALAIFEQTRSQNERAAVLTELGAILFRLGKSGEALYYYANAEEIFRGEEELQGLANVLLEKAEVYLYGNNCEDALAFLNEAENIMRNTGDNLGLGRVKLSLGIVHRMHKEFKEAYTCFVTAEKLFGIEQDQAGLARSLFLQGEILLLQNDFDDAQKKIIEAETLYRAINDDLGLSYVLVCKGDISSSNQDYEQCMQYYCEALRLSIKEQDNNNRASILTKRASLYVIRNELDKAYNDFCEAVKLYHLGGQYLFEGLPLSLLESLCQLMNKTDEANRINATRAQLFQDYFDNK